MPYRSRTVLIFFTFLDALIGEPCNEKSRLGLVWIANCIDGGALGREHLLRRQTAQIGEARRTAERQPAQCR